MTWFWPLLSYIFAPEVLVLSLICAFIGGLWAAVHAPRPTAQ